MLPAGMGRDRTGHHTIVAFVIATERIYMVDILSRLHPKECKPVKLSRGALRLRLDFERQQKWRSKQLLHSISNRQNRVRN